MNTDFFVWVILPLLIFLARVVDVSLGTLRIAFVSRGLRYLASFVGFFEVIIWLLAIRIIMQNLNNFVCILAYGGGFALGNYVGILLEDRLAFGSAVLQVITQVDASDLIKSLRKRGYGVTCTSAQGNDGGVNVIHMVIQRSEFGEIVSRIKNFNPRAFYTLLDARHINGGIFPMKNSGFVRNPGPYLLKYWRKGK